MLMLKLHLKYKIDYIKRLLATAIAFFVFGFGGLFVLLFIYPTVLTLNSIKKKEKIGQHIIHYSFRFFVSFMKKMGIFSYETKNIDRLNRKGLLIVANHPSLIDVVFLLSFIKETDCIVKDALSKNIFTKGPLKLADYIINNSDPELLINTCSHRIKEGNSLLLFPEGTRTKENNQLKFKRGASNIALKSKVPITPVVIDCYPDMLRKGIKWYNIPIFKPHFSISVYDDIDISKYFNLDENMSLSARRLTYDLESYFRKEINKLESLELELKKMIIDSLELEDIEINDISSSEPLFGDGLGLDSIDALELGVAIKKKYNISLKEETEEDTQKYFYSVQSLARFIDSKQKG